MERRHVGLVGDRVGAVLRRVVQSRPEAVLLNGLKLWRKAVGLLDGVERFVENRIMGLSVPGREKVEALR